MRFAFANSSPSCPSSALPRRMTQRSQRMPVTCSVSVVTAAYVNERRTMSAVAACGSSNASCASASHAVGRERVDADALDELRVEIGGAHGVAVALRDGSARRAGRSARPPSGSARTPPGRPTAGSAGGCSSAHAASAWISRRKRRCARRPSAGRASASRACRTSDADGCPSGSPPYAGDDARVENRAISRSQSDHDSNRGGAPWRGSRPRISARVDSSPVRSPLEPRRVRGEREQRPAATGERAPSRAGTSRRRACRRARAMPCTPWRRAVGPAYSTKLAVVRLVGDLLLGSRCPSDASRPRRSCSRPRRPPRRSHDAASAGRRALRRATRRRRCSARRSTRRARASRPRARRDARDDLCRHRTLRERLRVDQHQLLLDAEREHRGPSCVLDHAALIPCTGRPAASHA